VARAAGRGPVPPPVVGAGTDLVMAAQTMQGLCGPHTVCASHTRYGPVRPGPYGPHGRVS
jgi:hypothetical protein